MTFNLETVLAVVISLITLNLLFIGFYIASVLREVKKTVRKAGEVIDEVDQTVKDGIEKVSAMEKPLQALAMTTAAFGGIIKTAGAIRTATQSIMSAENDTEIVDVEAKPTKKAPKKPKFFKKGK
ncbi:MAG: hypothetical protein O3B47_05370 [bacterium]|nr:hypothetical protein [bacterium]